MTKRQCPNCNGWGRVEKLGLFGFKFVTCKFCGGSGQVPHVNGR
jgi:DnaJ-class molecular chaperone